MRHAYLIIAHSGWEQLKKLISLLDADNNDIFIHIDKKSKYVPMQDIMGTARKSKVHIFQKYKVYWGSFEIVQTELLLFGESSKNDYDYYHLLSGADLPIKTLNEIDCFFMENAGKEFVHFDTDDRLKNDHEIGRRTKLYHFLQNYRRRYKHQIFNAFFTTLERISLVIQLLLHVDRMKNHHNFKIKYGSQWVSITDSLVKYILSQESLIYDVFKYTNCADELFIQSLVYNSDFKDLLYDKRYDDSVIANMRLIDIKKRGNNGNPYTWRINDLNELESSPCLWARKFSPEVDSEIIEKVCSIREK